MTYQTWSDIIQLAGVILLGCGITCEIIMGGSIWFIFITLGSIVFAVGTKLKGY